MFKYTIGSKRFYRFFSWLKGKQTREQVDRRTVRRPTVDMFRAWVGHHRDEMAGVFDIELHDADNVIVDDSDDDAIEVEEVKILMADSPALLWELKPAQFWAAILPALSAIFNFNNERGVLCLNSFSDILPRFIFFKLSLEPLCKSEIWIPKLVHANKYTKYFVSGREIHAECLFKIGSKFFKIPLIYEEIE